MEERVLPVLIGFAGEITGNEVDLIAMDPVFSRDGEVFVSHGGDWAHAERIPAEELRFVHMLRKESRTAIGPGQVVWAAGRGLVARSAATWALQDLHKELSVWQQHARGLRWRLGTERGLGELKARNADLLERQIHQCLFDGLEKSHGSLDGLIELYLAMDDTKSLRRFLNLALYYEQTRQFASYSRVRDRARIAGLTESDDKFDSAVEHLRTWLEEERLSERLPAVTAAVPDPELLHELAKFLKIHRPSHQAAIAQARRTVPWLEEISR